MRHSYGTWIHECAIRQVRYRHRPASNEPARRYAGPPYTARPRLAGRPPAVTGLDMSVATHRPALACGLPPALRRWLAADNRLDVENDGCRGRSKSVPCVAGRDKTCERSTGVSGGG